VSTKERAVDRGTRYAAASVVEIGREIRVARARMGASLLGLGRQVGISASQLSRMERGLNIRVSVYVLTRVLAVLGLRLSLKAYPDGHQPRDAGQLRLLSRFRSRCSPAIIWQTEDPVTNHPDDLRSWDVKLVGPGWVVRIDAEMHLIDLQALERRVNLKRRDGGPGRTILLVHGSRANRAILRQHGAALRVAFPLGTASILAALADGRDPGGDGIVVL
jgi:transcriptional regulator with XRE-family HTH domain